MSNKKKFYIYKKYNKVLLKKKIYIDILFIYKKCSKK